MGNDIRVMKVKDTLIWWIKKVTIKSFGNSREIGSSLGSPVGLKEFTMEDGEEIEMYLPNDLSPTYNFKVGEKLDFYSLILTRPRKFTSLIIV